jgi:hypothetical protein
VLERGRSRRLDLLDEMLEGAWDVEIAAIRTAAEVVERGLRSG